MVKCAKKFTKFFHHHNQTRPLSAIFWMFLNSGSNLSFSGGHAAKSAQSFSKQTNEQAKGARATGNSSRGQVSAQTGRQISDGNWQKCGPDQCITASRIHAFRYVWWAKEMGTCTVRPPSTLVHQRRRRHCQLLTPSKNARSQIHLNETPTLTPHYLQFIKRLRPPIIED